MEQKNVQAVFQLQDSFVKGFSINVFKKIDDKSNLNISGNLGFKIDDIRENEDNFIGQVELINELKISSAEAECGNIHISMVGLFVGTKSNDLDRNKFEEMLKLNGATTLSHLTRAYVYTVTGMSGMPQISTPMINFVEFFKNAKEVKEKNK